MDKLAKLPPKMLLAAGAILGAIYYLFLFDSGAGWDTQIQQVIGQLQEEAEKKKKTEAALNKEKEMKVNVETLTKQYVEISKRVPSSLNSIEISRTIEVLAKNSGAQVKVKKPGSPIKQKIFEELPVELTMIGTYTELAQFIYYTSINEKTMRIKSYKIETQAENKRLQFTGVLIGYRLADENSAGGNSNDQKADSSAASSASAPTAAPSTDGSKQ